jgi:hypothetical protein
MCNNWPNFQISVDRATGGLIGDTVIICGGYGGYTLVDTCYSLTSEKVTIVTHMSVVRFGAASIVINDNTLWVTGGYNYDGGENLNSTEYVTVTGTMLGPDLPMAIEGHAMVAINSTCSMVIGGLSFPFFDDFALTFFYDRIEGEWINGPSLIQGRYWHAAGIVTDEVTDEHFVAVTGGSNDFHGDSLESTEILQDGEWVQGKISNTICHLLEIYWSHKTIFDYLINTEQLPYYKSIFALIIV